MRLLITFACFVFSTTIFSQDCSNYYFLQSNKTIEMTVTNNKGKESGKVIYNITNSQKSGNSISATVNNEFIDTKGKSITKGVNNVKCVNGVMQMDMKVFIPPSQTSGSATASDVYLEYPGNMNVGDQLKDGHLAMDTETSGGIKSSVEIDITERKVEGKESVTTPAGTWECYKITSNNKITSRIAGIGIPIKLSVTEWFAPGFGIVKTESKTGKTEITFIK